MISYSQCTNDGNDVIVTLYLLLTSQKKFGILKFRKNVEQFISLLSRVTSVCMSRSLIYSSQSFYLRVISLCRQLLNSLSKFQESMA